MKNSCFSKILVVIFLFGGLFVTAQVRSKTNTSNNNKKIVKTTRSNYHNDRGGVSVKTNRHNRGGVRIKTNRHRVIVNKPNRPHVTVNRPTYNRAGYVWAEGYWEWNIFYGRYIWQQARWIKIKRNHYWVPGFWEITAGGFFWIAGYWELEY